MSITILGPAWPTTAALRDALASDPATGTFTLGGSRHAATEQLRRFRSVGLRTPEYTQSLPEATSWIREGHTVLGRREAHTQGRDIAWASPTVRPGRRWVTRDWWCRYVPAAEEWRIHVFDNRVIARGKKVYTGTGAHSELGGVTIRSRRNGWTLEHHTNPTDPIRDAAKAAVESCGYTYGAVDLLVTDTGDVVVLEVNRLPAVRDDYTLARYVEAIRRHVAGHPVRRAAPIVVDEPYEGVLVL